VNTPFRMKKRVAQGEERPSDKERQNTTWGELVKRVEGSLLGKGEGRDPRGNVRGSKEKGKGPFLPKKKRRKSEPVCGRKKKRVKMQPTMFGGISSRGRRKEKGAGFAN